MLIIPVCTLHHSRTALGIPIRGRHRQGISVAGARRILTTQVGNMAETSAQRVSHWLCIGESDSESAKRASDSGSHQVAHNVGVVQAPQHIHFSLQALQVLPHPPGHMLVLADRYLQMLIS